MNATDDLSAEWLTRAQSAVNADPKFRKRGSVDTQMGVKVGERAFVVSFAAFQCEKVREMNPLDARDADFIVEMSPTQWQRFLAGRRTGDGRTLIDLDTTDAIVKAANPRKKLDFLRYHTSLQAFFDAGAAAAQ